MSPDNIFELFLWFVIYSFFGWLWEEIICSIGAKKLLNRGFMSGPYCPIYGTGALIYIGILQFTEEPFWLFILGGFCACTIEYITSWAMEKLFHARWWDYSKRFCNINGRVCLIGFCTFGLFAVLFPLVHRHIAAFTDWLPNFVIITAAILIAISMISDLIATIKSVLNLNEALADYEKAIKRDLEVRFKHRNRKAFTMRVGKDGERHKILGFQQRRMLNNFPDLSSKYDNAFKRFRKMNLENAMVVKETKTEAKAEKKEAKAEAKNIKKQKKQK